MKRPTFNRCEQTLMIIGFFLNVINLLFVITATFYLSFKGPDNKPKLPAQVGKQTTRDSINFK